MRLLWVLASLTLIWSLCGPLSAQPKNAGRPKGGLPEYVIGRGENEESAKNDVARSAVVTITDIMEKNGLRSFKIDEKFVRDHLLDRSGKWGKDVPVDLKDGNDEKPFKQWIVPLRTDADWWREIVRRDRVQERTIIAQQRQTWAYRVMIGLSILLFVGFGYVRLDEYTHRRYTNWLRVAGVGFATTMAAGWWWMFQGW
jgi:hypothetical protein